MLKAGKIITVGLSPTWDCVCRVDGIGWGDHKVVSSRIERAAGKAMNVSRALAWMEHANVAAGLWGSGDFDRMAKEVRSLGGLVKVKMTKTADQTRQNVTVIDTDRGREMHLRNRSELLSVSALRKLRMDMDKIVTRNSVCVFAGSIEADFADEVIKLVEFCRSKGAKVVADSSGEAMHRIVDNGGLMMIKPNVTELAELVGRRVRDSKSSLARAGRDLLDKAEIVLISRGPKGALAVTEQGVWQGCSMSQGFEPVTTVGCGDYMLAGFLKGLTDSDDIGSALGVSITAGTAKAYGMSETLRWVKARQQIKVEVNKLKI